MLSLCRQTDGRTTVKHYAPDLSIRGGIKNTSGLVTPLLYNFTRRQYFQIVKIQSICIRQIKVTQKLKFVLGKVENIVGKGENAGYQHFPVFLAFSKAFFSLGVKSWDCVVMG